MNKLQGLYSVTKCMISQLFSVHAHCNVNPKRDEIK